MARHPPRRLLLSYAGNLRQAYPDRLEALTEDEIVEMMLGPHRRRRGRRRCSAEEDDRRLYATALLECLGVAAKDSLKEGLGSTTHPEYPKLLRYYEDHRDDIYRRGILLLRQDKEGRLSVLPADDLPPELPDPIFDVDELFALRPKVAE